MTYRPGSCDRSSGEICRGNRWDRGTHLVGTDGVDEQRVTITAVGVDLVLAVDRGSRRERPLDLRYRQWRAAGCER